MVPARVTEALTLSEMIIEPVAQPQPGLRVGRCSFTPREGKVWVGVVNLIAWAIGIDSRQKLGMVEVVEDSDPTRSWISCVLRVKSSIEKDPMELEKEILAKLSHLHPQERGWIYFGPSGQPFRPPGRRVASWAYTTI